MTTSTDTLAVAVLTGDGTLETRELDSHKVLQGFYEAIGCTWVDAVRLRPDLTMWLDDEGLYTAPANIPATVLARACGLYSQAYHGTVVFTGGADNDGNTLPLHPGALTWIQEVLTQY